jgi:hypothetical protein
MDNNNAAMEKPRRRRQRPQMQQQQQQDGGPLGGLGGLGGVNQVGDLVQNTAGNAVNGVTGSAGKAVGGLLGGNKEEKDDGRDEQLRLRLDLNLDIEVQLKAKIHGDLTLGLLYVLSPFSLHNDMISVGANMCLGTDFFSSSSFPLVCC